MTDVTSFEGYSTHTREVITNRFRNYDVRMVSDLLDEGAGELARQIGDRSSLLVTTPTVAKLYGFKLRAKLNEHDISIPMLVLGCEEGTKSLQQVERVCHESYKQCLDRKSVIVGLGGGVCTDIVTLAASWIRRGISYIRIPTTLIGQIDAGIGIKGAVNFYGKKSSLGCFYPPETALIDPMFLKTISTEHIACGLAEAIKMSIIRDRQLFELIEEHASQLLSSRFSEPPAEANEVMWRSIVRMLEELETNIFEDQTYQRLVDFGHTFSPLIESYSNFSIPHGKAVAMDMALCCGAAWKLGMLDLESRDRIIATMRSCELPIYCSHVTPQICKCALNEVRRHRGGAINLPMPTSIGTATFLTEHTSELTAAFDWSVDWLADGFEVKQLRKAA